MSRLHLLQFLCSFLIFRGKNFLLQMGVETPPLLSAVLCGSVGKTRMSRLAITISGDRSALCMLDTSTGLPGQARGLVP